MKIKQYMSLILFSFLVISCNKYDEGSNYSLKSKKSRLVGEWKLISFNGLTEIEENYASITPYTGACGAQNPLFETIIVKSNIIWEFEGDFDIKEKYLNYVRKYSYGTSYQVPDCLPVYNVADSANTSISKRWNFSNKKSEIKIETSNTVTEYEIIKLTKSDLKIENDLGDIYIFEKI